MPKDGTEEDRVVIAQANADEDFVEDMKKRYGEDTVSVSVPTQMDTNAVLVLRTRALLVVFSIRVLMRTAFRIVGPVMPLFIQQIAGPGAKIASLTGTITGLASATSAGSAIVFGRLVDRIGPRRILLACGTAACALYGLQGFAQTPTQFLILRVLNGVAMGGIVSSVSTLLAALAPKNRFGAVYGMDTSITAAANAVAPMVGAALTATWGLSAAFLGAAVMYGLATVVVGTAVPGVKARQEQERVAG